MIPAVECLECGTEWDSVDAFLEDQGELLQEKIVEHPSDVLQDEAFKKGSNWRARAERWRDSDFVRMVVCLECLPKSVDQADADDLSGGVE